MSKFNDTHFLKQNSACNDDSQLHDLKCNHRVKTRYIVDCGRNCQNPGPRPSDPLICPHCTIEQVRMVMEFEGLTMDDNDTFMSGMVSSREDQIKAIAMKQILRQMQNGYRPAEMVRKLSPLLNFLSEIDVGEDIFAEPVDEPPRKYKRPGRGSKVLKPSGGRVEKKDNASSLVRAKPLIMLSRPCNTVTNQRGGKLVTVFQGLPSIISALKRYSHVKDFDDVAVEDAFRIGFPNVPSQPGPGANATLKSALGKTPAERKAETKKEKRHDVEEVADPEDEEDEATKAVCRLENPFSKRKELRGFSRWRELGCFFGDRKN